MMRTPLAATILALMALILFACKTNNVNLTYFSNAADGAVLGTNDYEIKLAPDDELMITVTSLVPAATEAFNLPLSSVSPMSQLPLQNTQRQYATYLVDKEGSITMPVLGKVKLGGLTTREAEDTLRRLISKSVDDPVVVVRLVNFKVNVIGEVNAPAVVEVKSERFSVLDAIAAAGDLSIYGLRDQVFVVREENGAKTFHRLDLTAANVVASPYFYLRQNDVVYVAPNNIRIDNSKYNQNNSYKLTVISTIVSAASVVASLVIALAVK